METITLLRRRGMEKILKSLIVYCTDLYIVREESFLMTLAQDLKFALDNYQRRGMKSVFTKKELEFAKREGAKVGIKDPKKFLNMRWSELNKLLMENNLELIFVQNPKKKEKK